mmetsp:Transcript_20264/g.40109  ORF Transcript_20264/g.40109 Transcript_20264/m.40109 type:complete len:194 (-) Transcript_20264:128-709(-)
MLLSSNTITKATVRKLLAEKNWKLALSSVPSPSLSALAHNYDFSTSAASSSPSASTNSNPSEVDKFSSFAGHWWDSRANPLVGMNPIRIRFMREVLLAQQRQQQQQHRIVDAAPPPPLPRRILRRRAPHGNSTAPFPPTGDAPRGFLSRRRDVVVVVVGGKETQIAIRGRQRGHGSGRSRDGRRSGRGFDGGR